MDLTQLADAYHEVMDRLTDRSRHMSDAELDAATDAIDTAVTALAAVPASDHHDLALKLEAVAREYDGGLWRAAEVLLFSAMADAERLGGRAWRRNPPRDTRASGTYRAAALLAET
jgi:uncharacterized protein HemX